VKLNKIVSALSVCAASLLTSNANAALVDSALNWQTFETENFRVHYTPEYKDWALSSAREMEIVRKLIKKQQSRVLDEKVDAYIIDPLNASNGFAMPLSSKPYMALYATPPQSDSIIANSSSWQQLLVLHEYVHLVHLAQKSRSSWRNQLAKVWDVYDASLINGDRWVAEGYATLQESKLTGRGRLYHDGVESIIQQFATEGALPTYQQLSKADNRFMSGSMAYLIGVRYLKWLEDNYGENTLDAVWTRWSGVKQRTFDQSFEGVFQDTAAHLYQRFVAEYTYKAMSKERKFEKSDSKLWLDLKGRVNSPSISPDNHHLAIVETIIDDEDRKIILNVYSTQENAKAIKKFNKKNEEILENDPLDITSKSPKVFKREVKFTLNQIDHQGLRDPRWLDDETIIYGASTTDRHNQKHQDLFSWNIKTGKTKQLTFGENLRRFDINQNYIIAEQSRYGYSGIVKYTFDGKKVSDINKATTKNIYDFPRLNSDSTKLAYVQSALNEKWQIKIKTFDSNSEHIIPLPQGYQFVSYPEWSNDDKSLYFVAGVKGELKLYQYHFESDALFAVTSGKHPISWPIMQNDDSLLHLSINSKGPDVFSLKLNNKNKQLISKTTQSGFINIMDIDRSEHKLAKASMLVDESIGENKSYGTGPQQGTITLGQSIYSASNNLFELGYKSGDILSRFDWQLNISHDLSKNVLSGASGNIRWQGWPVKLLAHGYQFDLKIDKQKEAAFTDNTIISESGLLLEATYPIQYKTFHLSGTAQYKFEQAEINNIKDNNNYVVLGFDQTWSWDKQVWGIKQKSKVYLLDGEQDSQDYTGHNALLSMSAHINKIGLGAEFESINRSNNAGDLLSLGGYGSTLIQPKAHQNKVFAPELAFYNATANEYEKYEIFSPFEFGRIFYSRHKMGEQDEINVYGIKGSFTNDFGFTGITNLSIDMGLAQVNPENGPSDLQAWLGLWHKW
jgi:hypothetical protein